MTSSSPLFLSSRYDTSISSVMPFLWSGIWKVETSSNICYIPVFGIRGEGYALWYVENLVMARVIMGVMANMRDIGRGIHLPRMLRCSPGS